MKIPNFHLSVDFDYKAYKVYIYICKDKRKSCKDRIVIESLVLNPTMGTDVFRVKTVYLNCLNPSSLKGGISLFLDKPYKSYALTGDGVFL